MDRGVFGVMVVAMALFLSVSFTVSGQVLPQRVLDIIEQAEEDGSSDLDEMIDYYETLLANPLNINSCTLEELQMTGLLTDFQVVSLRDYRRDHGTILSWGEFSLIDGFDDELVALLAHFFKLKDDFSPDERYKRRERDLILRTKYKLQREEGYAKVSEEEFFKRPNSYYIGSPLYLYGRYKYSGVKGLEAGVTLEKDAGETFIPWRSEKLLVSRERGLIDGFSRSPIDYISLHIGLNKLKLGRKIALKRAVVGDFSARFGQGLVLWNSFSFSSMAAPSNIYKKDFAITPYTSADENRFFRGAAFTLGGERWSSSILFSLKRVDARVDDENYYSLPSGGYHNTISTIGSRKRLQERVLGANFNYRGDNFKAGLTVAAYSYDKNNMRPVYPYNMHQMYDGWWGNAGVDMSYMVKRVRFFGEYSMDVRFAKAWLAGVIWNPSHNFDISLMVRDYGVEYIATYSGAYSVSSSNANEQGVLFQIKYLSGNTLITTGVDFAHHPWKRYRVDDISSRLKAQVGIDTKLGSSTDLIVRGSFSHDTYFESNRLNFRLMLKQRVGERFLFASRGDYVYTGSGDVGFGYAFYLEGAYISRNSKFECVIRGAYFSAEDWSNRLYVYERDLPNSFSSTVLYGKGFSSYLFLRYKIDLKRRLYLKISPKELKSQLNMKF